ncbi:galactosylceramide sulfotransferase-like [Orbicella faveolata]|uniref:galactosylceramide sulfotransferase-like n=1 Tax=Orbicella faveolata TaxID=48498 RepID=UPI0009E541B0|nr:galactosylceramide sulfotransferase-like [Orbicella faveolata]
MILADERFSVKKSLKTDKAPRTAMICNERKRLVEITSTRNIESETVDILPAKVRNVILKNQYFVNITSEQESLHTIKKHKQAYKQTCSPINHVLFLKTHKTGGSTITNILNRYGDSKNLTFVLPRNKQLFTFLWPARFRVSYTAPLYNFGANILCNHARFNKRPMNYLFPKDRSRYITILRDPVAQYESVFNFMHFAKPLGFKDEEDPLGTFLKFPPPFQEIKPLMKATLALHLVRNPMLFDLGLDFRYFQNKTAVDRYIEFLDNEFDLVMILEHFDESLLLLKRLLCWELKDILHFKLNERQDIQKRKFISQEVREDIKSWNKADFMLYQHFNRTFWRKIKAQGPSFQRELKIFRRKKEALTRACLQKGNFLDEAYTGVYVKGYSLKKNVPKKKRVMCQSMMKNELSYVKFFREKMSKEVRHIEEPEEYLDDPRNDWEVASDLEHDPILSGEESSADSALILPRPASIEGVTKN